MSLHEWRSTALGSYLRFQKGVSYKGEYLDKPGLRLLGLGTIVPGGGISLAAARQYCGPVKPHQQIQPGEVYVALTDITQDGRVLGSPALLPSNARGRYAVTHHVAKAIIERPEGLDMTFLYYLLQSEPARAYFRGVATGTTVRAVSAQDAENLAIQLPPLSEQREIASILGALDDKIELNRRMNATLESMARALFQSWFVDFDPVRAKAEGRQPVGMDAETAALFPDSFEDSAIGPIPKGWEVTNLGAVLNELETGRRPKGGVASYTSGVPSVGAESINGVGVFDYSKTKYVPKDFYDRNPSGRVKDWDVLLYKDGGKPGEFRPRVGMYALGFPFESFSINEHVFRMRADQIGQTFLYFTVSSHRALEDFANKGGKAAIPGINQPDVKSTLLVLPVAKVLLQFNQIAQQLAEKIIRNAASSKRYSELRDTLLPKLLSGELRVGEVAA